LWQVSIEDVRVNGDTIFDDVPAIFDTGSTYIFGDWKAVSELYEGLGATLKEYKGYGYYSREFWLHSSPYFDQWPIVPCDSFPTVSFTFGGKTFEIPPEILRIKPLWEGSPRCFSSIIAQRSPIVWVIGLTFLQGVYSVFDYSTLQVGLADLAWIIVNVPGSTLYGY
jgi:cathepsin D